MYTYIYHTYPSRKVGMMSNFSVASLTPSNVKSHGHKQGAIAKLDHTEGLFLTLTVANHSQKPSSLFGKHVL